MDRRFDEGVAGAALAALFSFAGAGVLRLLPTAAALSLDFMAVSTVALAGLGGAIGVGLVRLAVRRPANGQDADYADTLSSGGRMV
jgi:hypothetical protein